MIRTIVLGAATALLVVGIPVAALGFSQSMNADTVPPVTAEQLQFETHEPLELNRQMQVEARQRLDEAPSEAVQTQNQVRVREMVHAETGIPEGEEPIQERTRAQVTNQTQVADTTRVATRTQSGDQSQVQTRAGDGEPQSEPVGDGEGHRHGQTDDAPKGNAGAAPSGDCPNDGECTNDGGATGNGPHGKNG